MANDDDGEDGSRADEEEDRLAWVGSLWGSIHLTSLKKTSSLDQLKKALSPNYLHTILLDFSLSIYLLHDNQITP